MSRSGSWWACHCSPPPTTSWLSGRAWTAAPFGGSAGAPSCSAAGGSAMRPPPEAAVATREIVPPFDPSERRALFAIAREAIAAQLEGRKSKLPTPPPPLTEPRGAFVTLHLGGELRGCVGFVVAILPLHRTVAEAAVGAAFHDFRFPPLTTPEFREITLELSVLSPVERVRPEEVVVGRHGLLISQGA